MVEKMVSFFEDGSVTQSVTTPKAAPTWGRNCHSTGGFVNSRSRCDSQGTITSGHGPETAATAAATSSWPTADRVSCVHFAHWRQSRHSTATSCVCGRSSRRDGSRGPRGSRSNAAERGPTCQDNTTGRGHWNSNTYGMSLRFKFWIQEISVGSTHVTLLASFALRRFASNHCLQHLY